MRIKCSIWLVVFLICNLLLIGQSQIGNSIYGENSGDRCGNAVSISGDGTIVAVGSQENSNNGTRAGQVRIFSFSSGEWIQKGESLLGDGEWDRFGAGVSLANNGNRVIIGAPFSDANRYESGQAKVFEWNNSEWEQLGNEFLGVDRSENLGFPVKISGDGNVIAIGSDVSDNSGKVQVYMFSGGVWRQLGNDLFGEFPEDRLGTIDLSVDGRTIALGSTYNDGNGENSGHVRVFQLIDGEWAQKGLEIRGDFAEDRFGSDVALNSDGNRIAISASRNDDGGEDAGHVKVYDWSGSNWTQVGRTILAEAAQDKFGEAISLSGDGNILAIGASGNDGNGGSSGHVRIYELISDVWVQIGRDIDGDGAGSFFGARLSLSSNGSFLAVGSEGDSETALGTGQVKVFGNLSLNHYENQDQNVISVYPNPVLDMIKLDYNHEGENEVKLYNIQGKIIASFANSNKKLDLSGLHEGIYILEIILKDRRIFKRITKS